MYAVYPEAPYAHELAQFHRDSARSLRAYRLRRAIRLGLNCWAYITLYSIMFAVLAPVVGPHVRV